MRGSHRFSQIACPGKVHRRQQGVGRVALSVFRANLFIGAEPNNFHPWRHGSRNALKADA